MNAPTISDSEVLNTRLALTANETAQVLRCSVGLVYRMAESGELPTSRLGKRLVIPVDSVRQLLNPATGPQSAESPTHTDVTHVAPETLQHHSRPTAGHSPPQDGADPPPAGAQRA